MNQFYIFSWIDNLIGGEGGKRERERGRDLSEGQEVQPRALSLEQELESLLSVY